MMLVAKSDLAFNIINVMKFKIYLFNLLLSCKENLLEASLSYFVDF